MKCHLALGNIVGGDFNEIGPTGYERVEFDDFDFPSIGMMLNKTEINFKLIHVNAHFSVSSIAVFLGSDAKHPMFIGALAQVIRFDPGLSKQWSPRFLPGELKVNITPDVETG